MEDLKTPWELFGVECGEGWFPLIEPILQYIQSYNKDKAEEYQIVVYQIKEKWGILQLEIGGKSSVSCPLKPSDSAPLKHSTMPP